MPDPSSAARRFRTSGLKRFLLGKPIPSHLAHHERLSRLTGLAVLSSDALSSVAYATDFIIVTLLVAGTQAIDYVLPISVIIASLLGDRRVLLSPDDSRVSHRRRRLHRREGEHRPERRPDRRRVAASSTTR